MANTERLEKLKEYLIQKNGASIKELSEALDVTDMTVRRDLKLLVEDGDVVISHGLVVYRPQTVSVENKSYSIQDQQNYMREEKERIGKAAAALIKQDDVVFMDVGTTVEHVASSLPQNSAVTAMCFAANTFFALQAKNVGQIIMSGGYYHPSTQAFESEALSPVLRGLRANKAFIAPSAASMEMGLTCSTQYDMQIKKLELTNSVQHIILITSDKFDSVKSTHFCDWDKVDMVITDEGIPERWKNFFQEKEIYLLVV